MKSFFRATGLAAAFMLAAGAAQAACKVDKAGDELSFDEANAVYDCLKESLYEGYNKGNKRWIPKDYVKDYRDWTLVSKAPAAPGFHSGRFLVTYVNQIGAAEYVKYEEERGPMPAGTLIAKESFSVDDKGEDSKGPLFFMEKVAEGTSPETGDWYYMMVAPNGAPQAVPVVAACSECHQGNFGARDGLGYPVEEVR